MPENAGLLLSIACAAGFGLLVLTFATRFGIPAIMPLLLAGLVLGPDGLNWVRPGEFGAGLGVFVKLCVAIILFEGALNLRWADLRQSASDVRNLVTTGAVITWAGGVLASHYVADLSWPISLLFGALVTVTGPTVVQPLVRRLHLPRPVRTTLEGEAILIDPIGAFLAVAILEILLGATAPRPPNPLIYLWSYVGRFVLGAAVGVAGGLIVSRAMKVPALLRSEVSQAIALAGVWAAVGVSEALMPESGILAAVAMGLVVQRSSVPEERQLRHFKGQLTILGLGMLFILLAANVPISSLKAEASAGVIVALWLVLAVRPLAVFISLRESTQDWRARTFIASISPRGIIAASVASVFAFALLHAGVQDGGRLLPLTFLTIMVSVAVSALMGPVMAWALGLRSMEGKRIVIVSAGAVAREIAGIMKDKGRPVVLIDRNAEHVQRARDKGLDVLQGNALENGELERAGAAEAETLLAVTPNPEVNVLAAHLARDVYGIALAYAAIGRPGRGADQRLIAGVGGSHAFGRPVHLREWEQAVDDNEARSASWIVPKGWPGAPVSKLAIPEDVLPLVRLRGKSPEIVHGGQVWRPGDEIRVLSRLQGDSLAQAMSSAFSPAAQPAAITPPRP